MGICRVLVYSERVLDILPRAAPYDFRKQIKSLVTTT